MFQVSSALLAAAECACTKNPAVCINVSFKHLRIIMQVITLLMS